jgi:iron complex transport system substrate-binding protein
VSWAVVLGVALGTACGGSSSTDTTQPDTTQPDTTQLDTTQPDTSTPDETDPPVPGSLDRDAPDLGQVVSLAEEFVLADLLALGIEPVASTATVDTVGFQGLDGFDTSGIEVLPQTTLSLEYLASLRPDTIVTLQFFVDQVGAEVLEGIADVIVVPDGLTAAEQIVALGDLVGRPDQAAAIAADIDAATAEAAAQIGEGCTLSLAAVYPGPTVAAFVDGSTGLARAFEDVGCRLIPGPDVAAPDANGRAFLSSEQFGLLDQPTLVLMQNATVDGESEALDEIEDNPIWQKLPAVAADSVVVIDRLGYPGAPGLVRFVGEVPGLLGTSLD